MTSYEHSAAAHNLAARSMRPQWEIDAASAAADRAAAVAATKRRIASVKRTAAARAFAAANTRLCRMTAPLALIRRADDAARAIADGVLPVDLATLTAEMLAA